jgi:hypothetical protein
MNTGPTGVGIRYVGINKNIIKVYQTDNSVSSVPIVIPPFPQFPPKPSDATGLCATMGPPTCGVTPPAPKPWSCMIGPTGVGVCDAALNACGDLTICFDDGSERPGGKLLPGPTGTTGSLGYAGPTGPVQIVLPGNEESSAPAGYMKGATGPTGPAGVTGVATSTGYRSFTLGSTGSTGNIGNDGTTGPTGFVGSVGRTSLFGATGFTGNPGTSGSAGPTGLVVTFGPTGPNGATGVGFVGSTGTTGTTGPTGSFDPYNGTSQPNLWGSWTGSNISVTDILDQLRQPVYHYPTWFATSGAGADTDAILLSDRVSVVTPNIKFADFVNVDETTVSIPFGTTATGCVAVGNRNIAADFSQATDSVHLGTGDTIVAHLDTLSLGAYPSLTMNAPGSILIGTHSSNLSVVGSEIISIGKNHLFDLTSATNVVSIGSSVSALNDQSVAIGALSGPALTSVAYTTSLGSEAGRLAQQSYGVHIGYQANCSERGVVVGDLATGSGPFTTCIGSDAHGSVRDTLIGDHTTSQTSDSVCIGSGAQTAYQSVCIGSQSVSNPFSLCIGSRSSSFDYGVTVGSDITLATRPSQFYTIPALISCDGYGLFYDSVSGQVGPYVAQNALTSTSPLASLTRAELKNLLLQLKPVKYTHNGYSSIGVDLESVQTSFPDIQFANADGVIRYDMLNVLLLQYLFQP